MGISDDGKSVVAVARSKTGVDLLIYATGAGETRKLPTPRLDAVVGGRFLPDGRLLVNTAEPGRRRRWNVLDPKSGQMKPLPYEGYRFAFVAPDGKRFSSVDPDGRSVICTVDGDPPKPIPGFNPVDTFAGWSSDGVSVYVRRGRATTIPARIDRVSLATGRSELFKEITPPDMTGVVQLSGVEVARDGRSYAYGYSRLLSTLFIVDGVK